MASIEKRSGSWSVYWRHDGRKQRTTWSDEKTALKAKAYIEAVDHQLTRDGLYEVLLGPTDKPTNASPLVRDFADRWLNSRTRPGRGQINRYRSQLDRVILPEIGHLHMNEVSATDVAAVLVKLRQRVEDATVTRYYALMHAMFRFAEDEKVIEKGSNPAKRTDFVRDIVRDTNPAALEERHCYLEPWEIRLIVSSLAPDARPLVEFLADSGCRYSEGTAVPVSAVRPKDRQVLVYRAWKNSGRSDLDGDDDADGGAAGQPSGRWYLGTTKGRQKRAVTLGERVWAVVAEAAKGRRPDALLFPGPGGERWDHSNFVARRWDPAVTAAMRCAEHPPPPRGRRLDAEALAGPLCGDNGGLNSVGAPCRRHVMRGWDRCHDCSKPEPGAVSVCDCPGVLRRRPTPHDLRHSQAAWQIAAGVSIGVISKRLGHFDTSFTSRVYGGILPSAERESGGTYDGLWADEG